MTDLRVEAAGVGGIDETTVRLPGDVAVVAGENASNKTSLLRAIAFGLGHSEVPVRSGASEARVALTLGERTVTRTARRTADAGSNGGSRAADGPGAGSGSGSGIETGGEAWLADADDVELLERFACLLEFSDLRRAVREGGDVERLLKSPMDLDALEDERSRKVSRRADLREELADLEGVEDRLAARRRELSTARDRVRRCERAVDELRTRQAAAADGDDELEARRDRRRELVDRRIECEERVEDLQAAVDRLDERIADVEADLADAREAAEGTDLASLRAERESIREQRAALTERIEVLQSVLTANREMLDSPHAGALGQDAGLTGDAMTCWACGGEATESEFESTLADVRALLERERERRREYDPRLEDLDADIDAAERARRRVADLEERRDELRRRRRDRRESVATKRERLDDLRAELADLDAELADLEADRASAVTDLTDAIEAARLDLHDARADVERLESAVADLEDRRQQRREKRERVETLTDEITALTERIENFEAQLREGFNGAMDDLLSALAFDGIDRVWLDGSFEVVIAREVDGVTRRDPLDHLAESEREVVGLVLGLTGYLTYDVGDVAPVLLLDALGALDPERTARLIAYFADEAPMVVAALLPDSAAAVRRADLEGVGVASIGGSDDALA